MVRKDQKRNHKKTKISQPNYRRDLFLREMLEEIKEERVSIVLDVPE